MGQDHRGSRMSSSKSMSVDIEFREQIYLRSSFLSNNLEESYLNDGTFFSRRQVPPPNLKAY